MRRKKDNDYRSSPHSLQSQSSSAHSISSSNGASASSTNLYQADLDPDPNYDIILGLCKLVDDPSPMYSGPDPEEIKRIEGNHHLFTNVFLIFINSFNRRTS